MPKPAGLPQKRSLAMFRPLQILSLALCIIAPTSNSARADNWVPEPADTAGITWINLDSIEVRDGLTQYQIARNFSKGVPPAANADEITDAVNCTTGEYFRWFEKQSQWINKREGGGGHLGDPTYDESGALRTLICKR